MLLWLAVLGWVYVWLVWGVSADCFCWFYFAFGYVCVCVINAGFVGCLIDCCFVVLDVLVLFGFCGVCLFSCFGWFDLVCDLVWCCLWLCVVGHICLFVCFAVD